MAVDIFSGWLFLAIYLATDNIYLATAIGVATGLAQSFWMISHRQKVDPMQWMALVLVVGLGSATILTRNPKFIVFKPSIMESCFGLMMLRPGWLLRYAPSRSRELIPRLLFIWGYVWAAAWFALAASNLVVAHVYGLKAWAVYTNFTPFLLAPARCLYRSGKRDGDDPGRKGFTVQHAMHQAGLLEFSSDRSFGHL